MGSNDTLQAFADDCNKASVFPGDKKLQCVVSKEKLRPVAAVPVMQSGCLLLTP